MTFARASRTPRMSRPGSHSSNSGSSPFTAPVRKPEQPRRQGVIPQAPGSIPAQPRLSAPGPYAPPLVHRALANPGEPLDANVRAPMERRFGRDFRNVRVHTGETAAASARAVDAQAYAVGEHLVFNRDRYAPGTVSGRRLLMHELAHAAQPSRSYSPVQGLRIGSPNSAAERSADLALQPRIGPAALGAQLSALAPSEPVLHRAVSTWGGTWDTSRYNDVDTGGVKDGIDIKLHFKPGPPVDASMISIVQKVTSKKNGAVLATSPTVANRSIPAGKPGEGAHIDQAPTHRNPLYVAGDPKPANVAAGKQDALWDTPVEAGFGQHGFRHVDSKGVLAQKDATIEDKPELPGRGPNSSQIFEDTALAVTGVQTGANYGSVQWGWKTDGAGNFSKLPLTKVSDTVPSSTFIAAQSIWNKSQDAGGNDVVKFFSAAEKFVQADNTSLVSDANDPAKNEIAKLAQNTRVEVIDYGVGQKFNLASPADKWVKITITDGPSVGKTGWVKSSQVARTKVKADAKP